MGHTNVEALTKVAAGAERAGTPALRGGSQRAPFGDHLSRASAAGAQPVQAALPPHGEQHPRASKFAQVESATAASSPSQLPEAEPKEDVGASEKEAGQEAPSQDEVTAGAQTTGQPPTQSQQIELSQHDDADSSDGAGRVEQDGGGERGAMVIPSVESFEHAVHNAHAQEPLRPAVPVEEAMAAGNDEETGGEQKIKAPSAAVQNPTAVEPIVGAGVPQESATSANAKSASRIGSSSASVATSKAAVPTAAEQPDVVTQSIAPHVDEPDQSAIVSDNVPRRMERSPGRPRSGKASVSNPAQRRERQPVGSGAAPPDGGSANNHAPSSVTQPVAPAPALAAMVGDADRPELVKPAVAKTDGLPATGVRSHAGHEALRNDRRENGLDESPRIDAARFVGRVARAFQTAQERGGALKLRLSPPELGSLRLELHVQEGVMAATLETENAAARRVLLEHLPMLRERLAEQNIRIERFDVDVRRDDGGGPTNDRADQQQHRQEPNNAAPWREAVAGPSIHKAARQASPMTLTSAHTDGINLLV